MFGSRRRHEEAPVEPDLPITPMLDMSFQLMAFFIFTFHPAPTEGQLALALPKLEGGGVADPTAASDQPVKLTVRVEAAPNGTIAHMSLTEEGGAVTTPIDLGADVKGRYRPELQKKFTEIAGRKEKSKLTLEIGNGLLQEYVVNLYDVARNIGFEEIAPVPLDQKRR